LASGPRVFIAGAHTYLGARLAAVCQERDFDVVCLAHENQETYALQAIGVEVVRGSILEPESFKGVLKRCDWAINLHRNIDFTVPVEGPKGVAKALGRKKEERRQRAMKTMKAINVDGAINFLETCIAIDVEKVMTLSTTLAIGDHRGRLADERFEHRRGFRSYYEKTMYDALFHTRVKIEEGAQVACVLPGPILGPRAEGMFTRLVEDYVTGRRDWAVQSSSSVTLTYIDDIVRGIFQIMDRRAPVGLYIFGNEPVTWEEFYRKLAAVSGKEPEGGWMKENRLASKGGASALPKELLPYMVDAQYKCSSEKAKRQVGWDNTTMEIWLAEIVEEARTAAEGPGTQAAFETFRRSSLPAGS
jgi:nucleoside-diphosphate-sugar epimerase